MIKKILITIIFILFSGTVVFGGACSYDGEDPIDDTIDIENCVRDSGVLTGDMHVAGGFKDKIKSWTAEIMEILGLLAVGAIVYGGFFLVISTGEEDKIKKGKDIIKWGVIGFLGVISAGMLIRVIIGVLT